MQDGHVVQERSGEVGQGPVGAQPLLGSSVCWGLWGSAVLSPGQEVVCWSPQSPAHHHPNTSGRPLCKPRGRGLVQGLQGCPRRAAGAHPVVSVAAFAGDMEQNGQGARSSRVGVTSPSTSCCPLASISISHPAPFPSTPQRAPRVGPAGPGTSMPVMFSRRLPAPGLGFHPHQHRVLAAQLVFLSSAPVSPSLEPGKWRWGGAWLLLFVITG